MIIERRHRTKEHNCADCRIGCGLRRARVGGLLAEFGWHVDCIDNQPERVACLRRGEMPIYEPGLDDLIERNVRAGRLIFDTNLAPAAARADIIFLAVGTPMRRGDGHADLSYIFEAVDNLAPHIEGFTVITTKSTVPVGTSRRIEQRLAGHRPDAAFAVCSNPEFLREGSAIEDFMRPDRVLVGCDNDRAEELLRRLLQAALAARCTGHVHGKRIRRTGKIRGERLPCHENQLHQRDCRPV